jgi:hypothetical protein
LSICAAATDCLRVGAASVKAGAGSIEAVSIAALARTADNRLIH